MKKRIYLFCNEQYGKAYLRTFQAATERLSGFDCFVVFSVKSERGGYFRKMTRMIFHSFKNNCLNIHSMDVKKMAVADVNQPGFYETVPIGSIGFVAGFNQIFKAPMIGRFSTFINFHPSLLPCYRGAIPSYWVIKNNETITGFTAHVVSEQIDAGDIIYQESIDINQDILESELDRKIAAVGSFYFDECLKAIVSGKPFRKKCIENQYAKQVDYVPAARE